MRKSFFGYRVSEVDVVIGALREENESLNATITTLQTQLKNSAASNGAKANLLEAELTNKEENLKKIHEENMDLLSQINSLTMKSDVLDQQKLDLITQIEHLHMQNEELNHQNSELNKQIMELAAAESDLQNTKTMLENISQDRENAKVHMNSYMNDYESLKEELVNTRAALDTVTDLLENSKALLNQKLLETSQANEELKALKIELEKVYTTNSEQADKLAALGTYAEDYNNVKEKLVSTYVSLNEKAIELERAQKEIQQFKDELAITKIAVEEQTKKKKQPANLNQASEIAFQAYYDMSKIRNEVVEYMHEQMKEYYQLVNDNSIKMHNAIEQRQTEYNRIIREFFTKTSEFRVSLSNIEDDYNSMVDYSINIDKISSRMNEIMDNFIRVSSTSLKKNEETMNTQENPYTEEINSCNLTEEVSKKPIVFKITG